MKKTVVITGGSKGIGKALAKLFVDKGYQVVISAKETSELKEAAEEIGATAIIADVRKEEDIENLLNESVEKFGRVDIWINNAGVMRKFSKSERIDMKKAYELFDTNVFGYIFGCRVAGRKMREQGSGIIVNVLSSAALDATRGENIKMYAASKWAARGFTDAFRNENKDSGIIVIAAYPGGTQTHLYEGDIPKNFDQYMSAEYVAEKIIANLEKEKPELELIIKRPTA